MVLPSVTHLDHPFHPHHPPQDSSQPPFLKQLFRAITIQPNKALFATLTNIMCGVNFFRYMKNLSTGQRRRFPLTNPLDWLRAAPNKRAMLEDALGEILERPTHACLHAAHEGEPVDDQGVSFPFLLSNPLPSHSSPELHTSLYSPSSFLSMARKSTRTDQLSHQYTESPLTRAIHAATQVANPDRLHINAMWEEILLHYFHPSTYAVEPCWHGVDPAVVDDDRDLMVSLLERDSNGSAGGGCGSTSPGSSRRMSS